MSKIHRRDFLKVMGGAVVAIPAAAIISNSGSGKTEELVEWQGPPTFDPYPEYDIVANKDWKSIGNKISINTKTQTISYTGTKKFSGQILYTNIKDMWYNNDKFICYNMPFIMITPDFMEMSKGWSLHKSIREHMISTSVMGSDGKMFFVGFHCLYDGTSSRVVVEYKNGRNILQKKYFTLRPKEIKNIYIRSYKVDCYDVPNLTYHLEDKPMLPICGFKNDISLMKHSIVIPS